MSWLTDLHAIIAAFEASDATQLELHLPPFRVSLRRRPDAIAAPPPRLPETQPDHTGLHVVRSPLTGVWYDAPSPGAPPYVRVGDRIEAGSTVGLIETMKVFNEVTADTAGIVRQIFVRRGELVPAQAPLLLLEPVDSIATAAVDV